MTQNKSSGEVGITLSAAKLALSIIERPKGSEDDTFRQPLL
jgi:hypothetical protein